MNRLLRNSKDAVIRADKRAVLIEITLKIFWE
jgi:hypothetical protein